jgi:hypothetical protein
MDVLSSQAGQQPFPPKKNIDLKSLKLFFIASAASKGLNDNFRVNHDHCSSANIEI